MKKLLLISNIPAPYMLKSIYEMQKYFNTEYWFYDDIDDSRPNWWKIDRSDNAIILDNVLKYKGKYIALNIKEKLEKFNPDIIILGGFSIPTNIYIYKWAKSKNKKVIIFSEFLRDKKGFERKDFFTKLLFKFYKNIDAVFAVGEHGVKYFSNFFDTNKIFNIDYPNDIDEHLKHPFREVKEDIKILYAHRLIDIYNPLLAIEIFKKFNKKYPLSKMHMNASGPLRKICEEKIKEYKLEKQIKFLDDIKSWNDLHLVYKKCDISISPLNFSNGNNSITEAMASGMGIIISKNVNFNDILLRKSKGGFIVNNDIDSFIEVMGKYMKDKELFKIHAIANREIVKEFSIRDMALKYYDIFKELKII